MIPTSRFLRILFALSLQAAAALVAQTPSAKPPAALPAAKPQPDTVVLNDDEKLIGHLLRANAAAVVFKSDLLGEVTIDWSKIKELHTAGRYAVVEKRIKLGRHPDTAGIPKGSLDVAGQTITVHAEPGAATQSIPVANTGNVVDEATFTKDVEHSPGLLQAWNGAVTAGASLVEATQESRDYTGAVHLVRTVPAENWLDPRDRTTFDFSAVSGFVAQPSTPRIKTDILHGDAERDEYFTNSSVYGFVQAIFDHNYSQALDLEQNYGGGIGWTTIKKANVTLDLKGSVSYVRQSFRAAGLDESLVASTFAETLTRHLPRGMTFLEGISATPTWNIRRAWMAAGTASFNAPVYKRLSFTVGVQDNFLNDPPPGFHKNSFQATTGLTYSLR
jgi:hypothetical protein